MRKIVLRAGRLVARGRAWLLADRDALEPIRAPHLVSAAWHWLGRHPRVTDVALAVLVAAEATPQLVYHLRTGDPRAAWYVVLSALLVIPLAFRRSAPAVVFATIVGAAAVQWVVGVQLAADISILLALYTVTVAYPMRAALMGAAVAEIGAVLAAARWPRGLDFGGMLLVFTIFVLAAVMTGAYVRDRRRTVAALRARGEQLRRERDQHVRLAVAQERNRIARDLHDVIAHGLAVIITLAAAGANRARTSPDRAAAVLKLIAETGRSALDDARSIVGTLRNDAPTDPQPVLSDVELLVERVRATGVRTHVEIAGAVDKLPHSIAIAVYRIAQEALTNSLKHARDATLVGVRLAVDEASVHLSVHDDGQATDPAGCSRAGAGQGLIGMQERARSVGGHVVAGSQDGNGWLVTVDIPMHTVRSAPSGSPA